MPARCRVCGAANAACGPTTAGGHVAAINLNRGNAMSGGYLKPYQVEENGVTTTLMLSVRDAAARGLINVDSEDGDLPPVRGELKPYDVVEDGAETTLMLDDVDAADRGLLKRGAKTDATGDRDPDGDSGQGDDKATPPAKKAAAKKATGDKPVSMPSKARTRSGRRGAAAANTGKPSSSKA